MRNVRVDTTGELRCWYCGSATFKEKRTLKSKVTFGVGALLTKKKLKCQVCGQYNQTGNAKPYKGPANKRQGKKFGTFTNMHGVADGTEVEDTSIEDEIPDPIEEMVPPPPPPPPPPPVAVDPADEVRRLAALRDEGLVSDEEFDAKRREILGL